MTPASPLVIFCDVSGEHNRFVFEIIAIPPGAWLTANGERLRFRIDPDLALATCVSAFSERLAVQRYRASDPPVDIAQDVLDYDGPSSIIRAGIARVLAGVEFDRWVVRLDFDEAAFPQGVPSFGMDFDAAARRDRAAD